MELGINNLIKIILGVFVIVAVTVGVYLFFKNYVMGFFDNVGGEAEKLILLLVN